MITLPNLPTDNLYKFVFTAGLTIIILSTILFSTQCDRIRNKIDIIELSLLKNKIETTNLGLDTKELDIEITGIERGLDSTKIDSLSLQLNYRDNLKRILNDKNYREYLAFIYQHENDLIPYYEQTKLLNLKFEQLANKTREVSKNAEIILLQNKQLQSEANFLRIYLICFFIFMTIGTWMTIDGYKNWNKFVQIPTDERIRIELEKLKNLS